MNNHTTTLMENTFGSPKEVWTGEPVLPTPVAASQLRAGKPQPNQRRTATKRLTIDISADLHVRIKVQSALAGTPIGELIRDMLEQRFPANR